MSNLTSWPETKFEAEALAFQYPTTCYWNYVTLCTPYLPVVRILIMFHAILERQLSVLEADLPDSLRNFRSVDFRARTKLLSG